MAEPATPPAAHPTSEMAGQPDMIVDASGSNEDAGLGVSSPRSRKLSNKARQNQENQKAALNQPSAPKRQSGQTRIATNHKADGKQNRPYKREDDNAILQAL